MKSTIAAPMVSSLFGMRRSVAFDVSHAILFGAIFGVGTLLNTYAYRSIEPLIVAFCFFAAGGIGLLLPAIGGEQERRQYFRVFLTLWLVSGLAAIYAREFDDYEQLYSDAANFYYYASSNYGAMDMEDLLELTEGAGAVVLWGHVYDLFAYLGIERQPYVGIEFNCFLVALCAVFAVKTGRAAVNANSGQLDRLGMLISGCGTFWIFGALHLRDSLILFLVTVIVFAWVATLQRMTSMRILGLAVVSIAATFGLRTLRMEFVFVPAILMFAGVFAIAFFGGGKIRTHWLILLTAVGVAAMAALLAVNFESLSKALETGKIDYGDEAALVSSYDSLGTKFIVDAVLPLRLILGSIYLYVFPIPVWVGFQTESAYSLFKSVNAAYFYLVIPLLLIAGHQLFKFRERRTPAVMFLGMTVVGFTLAIAGTSLETRHLGAFLVPLQVLASMPDLNLSEVRLQYRYLLGTMLFGVVVVHLVWAVLKFGI